MAEIKFNKRKKSKAEIIFILSMLAIPVIHFCFFWIYVNFDTILLSFQEWNDIAQVWEFKEFKNYTRLFAELTSANSHLPRDLFNSISVFLWNDFVLLPISLFCAYVLYKKMPLGGMFKVIFFLPSIISVVVLTLAFNYMITNYGFLDTWFTSMGLNIFPFDGLLGDPGTAWWMILIYGLWSGIGYNIVLITGAMTRIPEEVIEAGKLDGLSDMKELWYVTIPLVGSTLGTLLLMGTTVMFTYFLQPKLLLGDNVTNVQAGTIALYIVNNVRDSGMARAPLGATMGILCAVVGTPIVFLTRKAIDKWLPAYEY